MKICRNYEFQLTDLQWERIFLKFVIKTNYKEKPQFILAKFTRSEHEEGVLATKIEKMIELQPEQIEDGTYSFTLNMAAADGRNFLENGSWRLAAIIAEGFCVISIVHSLAYQLDTKMRIFPYGKKYSYNVYFSLTSYQEEVLEMFMNSCFMMENEKWQKRRIVKDAVSFQWKLRNLFVWAAIRGIRVLYFLMSYILPKNGKRILLMSETKEYLWGNLKYIDERIRARGLEQDYELNYTFRKAVGNRKGAFSWLKTLYYISKSDYIFVDDYAPVFGYFKLNKKTKLIQVWHAGEGFKSVGYSRFGKDGSPYPAESCHKTYDYVTVGSEKLIHVYEEVFGIEKEAFLPTGMARLDDFLDEEKISRFKQNFYKEYPQLRDRKIILFAPTFRGTGQKEAYYDYDVLDLKRIYDFCGTEYAFLAKVHPFVDEKIEISEDYADRIFDFAQYPNINDLYYITDLLITDYSSNYYEYALLKKPVLFFTYDREKYELVRGVHRSVKEHAPGKVCDSFDEMMEALYHQDFEYEKIEKFVEDNFGEYDGHACDRIIDRIILKKEI